MAKYIITRSCGHETTHQFHGKVCDCESLVRYTENTPCPECQNKEVEEKYSLPELKGTEKQVSWARSIRRDIIKKLEKNEEFNDEEIPTIFGKLVDSKTFIDYRDYDADFFVKTVGEPLEKKLKKQFYRTIIEVLASKFNEKYKQSLSVEKYMEHFDDSIAYNIYIEKNTAGERHASVIIVHEDYWTEELLNSFIPEMKTIVVEYGYKIVGDWKKQSRDDKTDVLTLFLKR